MERCLNGTGRIRSDGTAVCDCQPCYSGSACEKECSSRGTCSNGTCDCGFEGWRGANCEIKGCPGWGKDCTGHGDCIPSTGQCICRSGWGGRGCEVPMCPGGGNCSNRGVCDGVNYDPPKCTSCDVGYMGRGCEQRCIHGNVSVTVNNVNGDQTYTCKCDACYNGVACDQECTLHGKCTNGTCTCDVSWRGALCNVQGCPGVGIDCSGKGVCLKSTGQCVCYNGWKGTGCEIPDCPGTPDCNNFGVCDGTVDPPVCVNCTNATMGTACSQSCIHGKEDMSRRGICVCDSCYQGFSCDLLCGGHGSCAAGTCRCNQGWKGTFCESVDCPGEPDCSNRGACIAVPNTLPVCSCNSGFSGPDCSQLVCPGVPMCSNRGNCSLVDDKPTCVCNHGFDGDSCQRCTTNFAPPLCDRCITDYIGFNTDCNVRCVHGRAKTPGGRSCVCFKDDILGYWNGTTCEECNRGYALPACTSCDPVHTGGNCTVECVMANAVYKDPLDTDDSSKMPVIPLLHCYDKQPDNSTVYWLGYENRNPRNVYMYPGPVNGIIQLPAPFITPGGELGDVQAHILNSSRSFESRGQPYKFSPSFHPAVFKIR